jgi:hypothetical protein
MRPVLEGGAAASAPFGINTVSLGLILVPILIASCSAAYFLLRRRYTVAVERLIRASSGLVLPRGPSLRPGTMGRAGLLTRPLNRMSGSVSTLDASLPAVRRQRWLRRFVLLALIVAAALIQSRFPYFDAEAVTVSGRPAGPQSGAFNAIFFLVFTGLAWGFGRGLLSPFGVWLIPSYFIGMVPVAALATLLMPGIKFWILLLVAPIWCACIALMGYVLFFVFRVLQRLLNLSPAFSGVWWAWLFATSTTLIEHAKPRFANDTTMLYLGLLQTGLGMAGLAVAILLFPRLLPAPVVAAPRLLFLRTFGHAKRTQTFLGHFARQWLEIGPIYLLGAPDVAQVALNVDSVAAWFRGRLERYFVRTKQDVDTRLDRHARRYRDGRYPIVELPCLGDSWQMAIEYLADRVDVAIMDLRSFSAKNLSCIFELEVLLRRHAGTPTLLLIGSDTDRDVLGTLVELTRSDGTAEPPAILELTEEDASVAGQIARVAVEAVLKRRTRSNGSQSSAA